VGLVDRAFLLSHPRFYQKKADNQHSLEQWLPSGFQCNMKRSKVAIGQKSNKFRA